MRVESKRVIILNDGTEYLNVEDALSDLYKAIRINSSIMNQIERNIPSVVKLNTLIASLCGEYQQVEGLVQEESKQ